MPGQQLTGLGRAPGDGVRARARGLAALVTLNARAAAATVAALLSTLGEDRSLDTLHALDDRGGDPPPWHAQLRLVRDASVATARTLAASPDAAGTAAASGGDRPSEEALAPGPAVVAALGLLPVEHRSALALADWVGVRPRDIAAIERAELSVVTVRIAGARRAVAAALSGQLADADLDDDGLVDDAWLAAAARDLGRPTLSAETSRALLGEALTAIGWPATASSPPGEPNLPRQWRPAAASRGLAAAAAGLVAALVLALAGLGWLPGTGDGDAVEEASSTADAGGEGPPATGDRTREPSAVTTDGTATTTVAPPPTQVPPGGQEQPAADEPAPPQPDTTAAAPTNPPGPEPAPTPPPGSPPSPTPPTATSPPPTPPPPTPTPAPLTTAAPLPGPPVRLSARSGVDTLTVDWSGAPADATGVHLRWSCCSPQTGDGVDGLPPAGTRTIGGLLPATAYELTVTVLGGRRAGEAATVTVRTAPPPTTDPAGEQAPAFEAVRLQPQR